MVCMDNSHMVTLVQLLCIDIRHSKFLCMREAIREEGRLNQI